MWAEYMLLCTEGWSRTAAVELLCNQWLCNNRKPGWSGHFSLLSCGTAFSGPGQSLSHQLTRVSTPQGSSVGVWEKHTIVMILLQ